MSQYSFKKYFRIVKSNGDGNCLYYSILKSNDYYKVSKLRIELAGIIERNEEQIQENNKVLKNELYEHTELMKNNGVWGTNLEMNAASLYFKKPIFSIEVENDRIVRCFCFTNKTFQIQIDEGEAVDITDLYDEDSDYIYILWNGKNHWDGLELLNKN